ncbi:MAG: hypothetical protein WA441_13760 [Methyloceanibacter sp.]
MPERGPVQLLLPFFGSRVKPGWSLGLAVAFVALLGPLPGESVLHTAKLGLTQLLPQVAWKHALAGEPEHKAWPWDGASPVAYRTVPRLGLSAAVLYDGNGQRSERKPFSRSWRASLAMDRHDPHLALGDVAIGDGLPVTTAEGLTPAYQVTGRENLDAQGSATDASRAGASDPHLACPHHSSSFAGALRFLIEGAHIDHLESQATSHEQKL